MAELPIMPVMTDAYLGDTTHLSTLEHGAYWLLLVAMWRNGAWLPSDDRLLAKYAGLSGSQWRKVWVTLAPMFSSTSDGRLEQKKLAAIYKKAIAKRDKFRENGAKGGRPKSLENNETPKPSGNRRDTQPEPGGQATLILTPESNKKDSPPKKREAVKRPSRYPPEIEAQRIQYFERAAEIIKSKNPRDAGSLAARLLAANGDNVAKARRDLEAAASANDVRSYLGAIIKTRGQQAAASSGVTSDPAL